MKVLHLLDSLNRGGTEMLELDLCRNAAANGMDLTFVATGGGDLEPDFRASGVPFLSLRRRLPVDLRVAAQIRRIINDREIDVVHGHQPVDALHLYLATRSLPTKVVLTLHGVYAGVKNELALRLMLRRVAARVVVSNDVPHMIAQEQGISCPEEFVTIYNGLDPVRLCRTTGPEVREDSQSSAIAPLPGPLRDPNTGPIRG
jgi:hypothetical protein